MTAASCKDGDSGGFGGEFNGPINIATDGLGHIYVADDASSRIQKFDPSGQFERTWGKNVIADAPGPNPSPTRTAPTIPPATTSPTGQRGAALKKCKKKHGKARTNCIKKAKKLPV